MSIANTLTQLQMVNRLLETVSVPSRYPGSINTADLPLVIFWPGRAIIRPITSRGQIVRVERRYDARYFLEALGQNDFNAPVTGAISLLDTCLSLYFEHKTLQDGVTEIDYIEDSGIVSGGELVAIAPLVYAGNAYKGFVITLTILEYLKP